MMGFFRGTFYPWIYLILTAVISALVSYPLYLYFGEGDISFFRSLVSRMGQALLLIGLIPILLRFKVHRADFGMTSQGGSGFFLGFFLGLLMLSLHGVLLIALDLRTLEIPKAEAVHYYRTLTAAAFSGIGVALLEETLFRGALLFILLRLTSPFLAVVLSALDFSLLHFIGSQWTTDPSKVGLDTGFRIALDGFSHLHHADPSSFLALFAAGLFLAVARLKNRGGLFFTVGIHAGWVFVIKILKALTVLNKEAALSTWVGSYDHVIGYLSSLWLLPLIGVWVLKDRWASRSEKHVA